MRIRDVPELLSLSSIMRQSCGPVAWRLGRALTVGLLIPDACPKTPDRGSPILAVCLLNGGHLKITQHLYSEAAAEGRDVLGRG